jgi:hypothetical protein
MKFLIITLLSLSTSACGKLDVSVEDEDAAAENSAAALFKIEQDICTPINSTNFVKRAGHVVVLYTSRAECEGQ